MIPDAGSYYWDGEQHDMLADAQNAAAALVGQLNATILPRASARTLWHTVGIIQMDGIDDFGTTEVNTVAQAKQLVAWATKHDVQTMSFWALQRDNGDCPGEVGSNECSGIVHSPRGRSATRTPPSPGGSDRRLTARRRAPGRPDRGRAQRPAA